MIRYHYYRSIYGNWVECECDTPFDSHGIISYNTVPILSKRLPAIPGSVTKWT